VSVVQSPSLHLFHSQDSSLKRFYIERQSYL
jgi:hypothetical protein